MSKLPILMYHNITNQVEASKNLTISVENFERQICYLIDKGYVFYHLKELTTLQKISKKAIVLTFDDVTLNQLELAVPLLNKYNIKATFFIPFKYIGKTDEWNSGAQQIMTIEQLKGLDERIELGFHSYAHKRYSDMNIHEWQNDMNFCKNFIEENKLNVAPFLAYPYGNYPKREPEKTSFFETLKNNGLIYGLRIGNRLNDFPIKNPFEIQRIDIKGEDSLFKFKLKVKFGKLKLF